jgi:phage tail sheath gpL-like
MKHVANPLVNGKVLYVTQSSGNIGTFTADNSGGDADTTVTLSDATTIAILDNDASGVGTPDGTAVYYDEATDGLVSITETGADLFVLTSARLAIRVKYVASISGMKAVAFDDDAAPATDRVLFTATGAVNATAPLVTDYLACTARNAGTLGTDIDLRHTHLTGERLPAGLSVCAIPMYGGATDPTITALISAMGSERYDCVVHPWAATTQMDAVDTEIESRWTPQRGVMGFALTGAVDTVATLASFGNNRDKRFETVWTAGPNALNPPWELAAAASGVVAQRMRAVPAPRGVKDMALTGITALADGEGLTDADCQSLLVDGIAPLYCEGGKVRIRKWVSTYQTNDAAQESEARRDPIHAFDDMRMVRDMKAHLATVFANKRVTEDAVSTAPDTVPLSAITRAVDSRFLAYQGWGIVQDVEAFVANRVVEADDDVPTRVNILFPPVRVPELDQLGILLQPRLVTDDEAAAE